MADKKYYINTIDDRGYAAKEECVVTDAFQEWFKIYMECIKEDRENGTNTASEFIKNNPGDHYVKKQFH